MTYFHEVQRFRDSWLWLVVLVPIAIVLIVLLSTPPAPAGAIAFALGVAILVAMLLGLARLETTVTPDAVVATFHDLWPTRRIRLDDIADYAPMRCGMWDSGGWGVHLGLAGMTYNVSGNDGIHFRLKDRRQVLVGTQHPVEFAAGIATAMAGRGTG